MRLGAGTAAAIAELALAAIHRAYPVKPGHVLLGDGDARPPREVTPVFYGAFDWHSSVHGHWTLVRLVRLFPDAAWAPRARGALARSFTPEGVAAEVAYLAAHPTFEVPYGVAWLLQLDAELAEAKGAMRTWRDALAPLVALGAARLAAHVGRLPCPVRGGEHAQTAFAIGLALDHARTVGSAATTQLLVERARAFYGADRDAPVDYEPSAHDFLSPSLAEADVMRRVLDASAFPRWLDDFLPRLDRFEPVVTIDPSDGKLAHWGGLDLSRAWMLRGIASALPADHRARAELAARAEAHERAGLAELTGDHYAGAHWLGSFALYSLSDRGIHSPAS
ncbi:MAG TPA: DUF2891 domain-containing protein [Kofleriaceae bacterium]|nr:DUF2891 domain-containing protein [Kofleriaceae bacterium]